MLKTENTMDDTEMTKTRPQRHILVDAVVNVLYFLGYIVFFHCLGM